MKKTLLFDLDGTLFHSIPTILETFRETFLKIKIEYPGDNILSEGIGSHLTDIFTPLIPLDLVKNATDTYRNIYLKKQREGNVCMFPDMVEVLTSLSSAGRIMGVVTTKMRSVSEELLAQTGIDSYFQVVVGSEDVQKWKPNPEPLFLAAKKLSVSPIDCIYIGDSVHDAKAAKSAGMEFIGVLTGTGKREELEKFGKVYNRMRDMRIEINN